MRGVAMEVGKRIVELRQKKGITTNKLANLCGLSQSFVRSVELGEKNISVENLTLICDALHVSLKDFFDCPVEGTLFTNDELQDQLSRLSDKQKKALLEFIKTMK